MKIEIVGKEAEVAAKDLLNLQGIEGTYETLEETKKAEVLTTIATIVGIVGGSFAIAEKLYSEARIINLVNEMAELNRRLTEIKELK